MNDTRASNATIVTLDLSQYWDSMGTGAVQASSEASASVVRIVFFAAVDIFSVSFSFSLSLSLPLVRSPSVCLLC